MNLNNFKATWSYFKIINQMDSMDSIEILNLIEEPRAVDYQIVRLGLLPNSVMFGLLILFCQSC